MNRDNPTPDVERLVRRRLGEFADRAPTTVRRPIALGDAEPSEHGRVLGTRRRIAGIGAAVIALGGGVALTTVAATGGDGGGANTPEAAVREFIEAIEQRDVIGAIDVLDPAESGVMVDAVRNVANEAKRVGLLSGGADLNDVAGSAIDVSALVLSSESIGSDLSLVHLDAGTADLGFDFASLPFGDVVNDVIATNGAPTVQETSIDLATADLSLATVRRDDRWYVSAGFTVAEAIRNDAGAPSPLDAGVVPAGFDTPEAAASAFWTRLAAFDLTGAIATAAPGEGDVLARHASLWVPDAERSLRDAGDGAFQLHLDGLQFDIAGDGDTRTATPTSYLVTGTLPPTGADDALPPFDDARPTLVTAADGSGFHLLPAGEPIPASFDDLDVLTDFDPATLSIDGWNSAVLMPNGDLQTFWFDGADTTDPEAPRPFTLDFSDGCATVSGLSPASGWYGGFADDSIEVLPDGDRRSCSPTDALSSLRAISFYVGHGAPPALPAIGVSNVDGRWYMSPIGSVGAMLLEVMADIDDGEALAFDSPLGSFVYGIDAEILSQMVVGRREEDISELCRTAVIVDADDIVIDIVEAPSIEAARDCTFGGFDEPIGQALAVEPPTSTVLLGGD